MTKNEYISNVVSDARAIQRAMTDKQHVAIMDILIHGFKANIGRDHDYSMKVKQTLEELDLDQIDFILEAAK